MPVLADSHPAIPLTEATFFVLLSLSPEPKHGYAILKDVQTLSEDRVTLSTGTLYGALKRLLDQGWVKRVTSPALNNTTRERKAYALTERGRRVFKAEVTRLEKLVVLAQLRAAEARV